MRVELRSIEKRFGRVKALQGVSLDLPAGSRTALIGPNGSGKSTLVRVLMGMLHARGSVLLDGSDAGVQRTAVAHRIAYVPQIAPRFAAPVLEVVSAITRLRDVAIGAVRDIASTLGVDLDSMARRPFRALSGGQRQKLLAALALASNADLLLFDEPTASMDPHSRSEFFRLVECLPTTVTVLLCSHRLDEIRRLVQHVVLLDEGRVAWQGSATAYLDDNADAVVEVAAQTEMAAVWLQERGFVCSATGWWSKSMPAGERAAMVTDIVRSLDGNLRDVLARDVERLQPRSNGQIS